MEPTVFNVIILDKSGSMGGIRRQAVDGLNETLGGIRSSHKNKPEFRQSVTIVAFCGCETKAICYDTDIEKVADLRPEDYQPCCTTPLYDAIGNTISRLHQVTGDDRNAMVSVTIITDGYENASTEFSGKAIKALIDAYKQEGWMFAYIGADHDVESVASTLDIDNVMRFDKTEAGTRQMFIRYRMARQRWEDANVSFMEQPSLSMEELLERKRCASRAFFDDDEPKQS